jgi:TP901 family phage tail tape measure protein
MAASSVNVLLSTNVKQFKTEMALAGAAVTGFGVAAYKSINKVEQVGRQIGGAIIGVGASMVGAIAVGVKAASVLETAMQNVATVWDEAGQKVAGTFLSLADAGDQILELSTELPQSASQLAEGLYSVASSGFQGSDAMLILEESAKAASAGLTDAGTSTRVMTAVLNAYGMTSADVEAVSDTLFQTVNLGALSFEQLAQNMGDIVPGAAALGVPLEDAGAALATVTLGGFNASQAATAMAGVFRKLTAPTESMTALLSENGYESGQAAIAAIGLSGVMALVQEAAGGDAAALRALFEEQEAVNGATVLLAQNGGLYAGVMDKMGTADERAGATARALAEQAKALGFQMDILKNSVVAIVTEFGQTFLPVAKFLVGILQELADRFAAIPDPVKKVLTILTGLATLLVLLAGAWVIHTIQAEILSMVLQKLGVQAYLTSKALNVLKVSAGVLGAVLLIGVTAMSIWGNANKDAKKDADDFKAAVDELKGSLDAETGAITAATRERIALTLVEKGLDEDAKKMGISISDMVDAYLGEEDALKRVQAAAAKYRKEMEGSPDQPEQADMIIMPGEDKGDIADNLNEAEKAYMANYDASIKLEKAVISGSKATKQATKEKMREVTAVDAAIDAHADNSEVVKVSEETYKALGQVLEDNFGVMTTYRKATEAQAAAERELTTTLRDALDARQDVATDALDDRHEAEQEAFEDSRELLAEHLQKTQEAEAKALEDRQKAETKALDDAQEAETKALEDRQDLESQALDDRNEAERDAIDDRAELREREYDAEARRLRDALDDLQRIEKDAFDDRMEDMRDANDKRIEAEGENWALRKADIQHHIDDTFGLERQYWEGVLLTEEDAYEDRIDVIEEEGDAAVRTEGHAFDDRQEAQDRALGDRLQGMQDHLDAIKDAETDAWDDEHRRLVAALTDQHTVQTTALADRQEAESAALTTRQETEDAAMVTRQNAANTAMGHQTEDLQRVLDDRHERERINLQNRQNQETAAFDTRRRIAEEKQGLSLSQLQTHLDAMEGEYDAFNANLAIIASRGGADVLAQVAALGPEIVAQAAQGGVPQLTALLESIRMGVGPVPKIAQPFNPGQWSGSFAEGGIENHVAQIAAAGAWRLWAEPETGGEAYIPLALAKRTRSTSILAQTAGIMGYSLIPMAAGGIVGGRSGAGPAMVNIPIHVEVSAAVGADPDALARLVADKAAVAVRAGFDALGRQVTVKAWRN